MTILTERLSANLSFLFTEWPFLDRFAAAADVGFSCVEFLFPYDFDPAAITRRLIDNNLSVSVFNAPPGDWLAGDRGLAALPERADECRAAIARALDYARVMKAPQIHLLAGNANSSDSHALAAFRDNLSYAVDSCGDDPIRILIEPLNGRDMPGYFLNDFAAAERLIRAFPPGKLGLQFDIYHCRMIGQPVLRRLAEMLPVIAHVQIAGAPGRNEPSEPDLPIAELFALLDRAGYAGRVGCEYHPAGGTLEGLGWIDLIVPQEDRSG